MIAGALRTYAQDAQPLAQRLNELRAEAQAFRTGPAADDEWREDADLIDENLNRRNKIAEVWAAFQDVEKACHDKIVSLVGGTPLKTDDGSGKKGMYGYDAEVLKQAESLPWGDAVEESTPGWQVWEHGADFVTGFAVDGVWATVVGIGTLAGFNGWDAAGDAWSGLATLGEGLGHTIVFGVDSPFWTLPEEQLPARMRESRVAVKETGKALLAWDDWEAHPGRAAGAVTFNVLTTVFTGGAGGAAATTAKAGAVAKALSVAGKVSRVVDPMTYVFKGAGAGLSKIGDAMASLRNLGRIQVPPLPEGAIALPEGGYKLADGTLRLPEASAIPEGAFAVPPRTVKLPEGTPIPAGAVDLGDGMVQLPRRGEVPAGAVAVEEGTVKVPAGATALPPDTVPLPGAGKDFFYNAKGDLLGPDGTLLQRGTDAKPETPPGQATPDRAPAPATNPSVLPPARQPVLVGADAADGARLGGDAGRLGPGHGDDGLRLGDDAPGPVQDRTPGGGAGDNMPTNNLDNGAGGRSGDTTPTGGGRGNVPDGSPAHNGVPGGSAADNGVGSGSGLPDAPGPGGFDDAARAGDEVADMHSPQLGDLRHGAGSTEWVQRTPEQMKWWRDEHVRLANEDQAWFKRHYDILGRRGSSTEFVDGQHLPQIKKNAAGKWIAVHDLPNGPREVRFNPKPLGVDSVPPGNLPELHKATGDRRVSIDLINAQEALKKSPTLVNHAKVDIAQQAFDRRLPGVPNNSKISEALGEKAALLHAVPVLYDVVKAIDLPKTPNGANMFDAAFELHGNGRLVVEAKAPSGQLDWRHGKSDPEAPSRAGSGDDGGAQGMRVKQGTRVYLRTIFAEMTARGGRDAEIAADLRQALKEGRLEYVLVKARDDVNGSYAGVDVESFKV
ncbi:hypothetical protein [Streptomyces sp. NPDC006274]|uniref:hypothetical protein n=1 Tax=Streptomyces sp. NPDC006274 TaxID=3154582 RepID=UPI0033B233B7